MLAPVVVECETAFLFRTSTLFLRTMSQEAANVIPPSAVGRCDPTAWVEQHGDYLFRYALIRLRNESVAEDLVQDALLAAFQGKERFTGSSTERSWLTGILKHKIMDHFRRLARAPG